jgi:hypothetical protein
MPGGSLASRQQSDRARRLREQPARHELKRPHRGAIKPLRIIDHADQRLLLGNLRQQAQHRKTN